MLPRRLALLCTALLVLLSPTVVHAGGVLMRLDADRTLEGEVVVVLTSMENTTEEVVLSDDGAQPDVTAGDGKWAGAAHIPYTEVFVLLRIGDEEHDGGTVSWSASDIPRDLDLSLKAGKLSVNAREATPHNTGEPTPVASPTVVQTAKSPQVTPADPNKTVGNATDGLYMIVLGLSALIGLPLVVFRLRKRVKVRRGPIAGLELQPSGGFAGPSSPALDNGLSYWLLPEDRPTEVLRDLVSYLGEHHRVLVVGPDLPPDLAACGAQVYSCSPASARRIGDYLEALHSDPRQRAVVVFYGMERDADEWGEQDDELPIGSGGIALLAAECSEPVLTHNIIGGLPTGWQVHSTDSDSDTRFVLPSACA